MKFIAAFFAFAALAIAPAAASAQIGPSTDGVTAAEPNGIIAILIGFTPPIGSDKGSYTAPIGSNKGSFAGTGWGLDEMDRSRVVAP
jgi:hypothetical protein